MIEIIDMTYARLGTSDLESTVSFATEILGLQIVRRENNRVYVRGDDRDHDICYIDTDPSHHVLGMELSNLSALESAASELEAAGISVRRGTSEECLERRVTDFIAFCDPTGNKIELTIRPFKATRRYFPTRDAGISEFSHVGLRTTDAKADEEFWTSLFNVRVNDWIGPAGLLSFDKVHHRFALFPADRPGIQHINFQVESIDDIMRSYYFLSGKQIHIVFGPGRHATSGAMFLYFEGPDGMVYEYSNGVRIIEDPEYRPRQFPFTPEAFCVWGAVPDIPEFRN
jgi:2,3-dihydroxy-p-cumate/2,3-dihydroxybenzoate 3,4-dioxygenase